MKKQVWSMTALVLLLAGCSQNEVTDVNVPDGTDNQVSLEASTGKNTRATDATLKTLQDATDGFKVFASKGATPALFINNEVYKYTNSKWGWNLAQDKFPEWPAASDYPVTFYAYHPAAQVTALSTTALTQSFTIKSVAEQFDLMAAKTEVLAKPATKRATLQFKHLFSKISFKANVSTGIKASILSIAAKQLKETRTYDFATTAWSDDASGSNSYSYVAADATNGAKFKDIVGSSTVVAIAGDNNALMLMPQSLADALDANSGSVVADAATKAHVEVLYRLSNATDVTNELGFKQATEYPGGLPTTSAWKDYTGPLFVRVGYSIQTTGTWEKGKAYTYVVQLPGTGGVLLGEFFYDDKGKETDLKVKYSGGGTVDPGTPPFDPEKGKDYIDFSVIVDSWDNQGDTTLN